MTTLGQAAVAGHGEQPRGKAALGRVEDAILKDHTATCVAAAIESGDETQQRKKFEELVDLLGKVKR